MSSIRAISPLGFPWETDDPFLFCVHHDDAFPSGNERMGPNASLAGRKLGNDFAGKDGWRMYHGETVPGFPSHPHRGFETVTIARRGFIDHHDSLGATARFGKGDVQWMTAGKGVVHAEMFPLLERSGPNPAELFQIWLNLPRKDKLVEPHFAMLWSESIPILRITDGHGKTTELGLIAGKLHDRVAPPPPPKSWAARPEANVAIVTFKMEPGARYTLDATDAGTNRALYFFRGTSCTVDGKDIPRSSKITLEADAKIEIVAGTDECELLLLQGRPIGEPVVQYGPFVMNTPHEIESAFREYERTQFGGWPWPTQDPVHPREQGRFARHADGKIESK